MRNRPRRAAIALMWIAAALPASASAIVVESPDERVAHAPRAFPFWEHVVSMSRFSAIYLGERWVLTANHLKPSPVTIGGERYAPEEGSSVTLRTGPYRADLRVFRLERAPPLPPLPIVTDLVERDLPVLMVGWGRGAGTRTEWAGQPGLRWSAGQPTRRWGRNRIRDIGVPVSLGAGSLTAAFRMRFDLGARIRDEGQAASGDSGGGVFIRERGQWVLAGVMVMVDRVKGQPFDVALDGNRTIVADLSRYRDQIRSITGLE